MLDAAFYASNLPDLVRQMCAARPGCTPAVRLHLAEGTLLELCEVLRITPTWAGFSYHRDKSCNGGDAVFLPLGAVTRVTISTQPAGSRTHGFGHRGASKTTIESDRAVTD